MSATLTPRILVLSFMAARTRSIPAICRELGGLPTSTLYHYLADDGTLKDPGRRLLDA